MSASLDDLREFFRVFPDGAGEEFIATHFGTTPAMVAQVCGLLGMRRVEEREPDGRIGVRWAARPAMPVRSNVVPFMRRAPVVDDGIVD